MARRLKPSLFDLLIIVIPLWFFFLNGGVAQALLSDADTGWHIRAGDWMIQHRRFITQDLFSWTRAGAPWFAWEWLTDILFSALHTALGLRGIVWFASAVSTLLLVIGLRHMVWSGANIFIALPLALIGFSASSMHLLARPHLWTPALAALTWYVIRKDRETPGRALWWLAPMTALWTNLHGGWAAGVVIAGLSTVGAAMERREWRRYALLAVLMCGASFANPYGWHLHAHMVEYLRADWIRELVGEFKSPNFRGENMAQLALLLVAALVACGAMLRRGRLVEPLVVLFWAQQSLVSARHATVFVAVAVPVLAGELARLWPSQAMKTLTAIGRDLQPALQRVSLWAAVPFLMIPAAPADLPTDAFPVAMAARQGASLTKYRLYTTEQWAGYLIYRFWPGMKVFTDGRSDFYGERISRDYCLMMNIDPSWRELVAKYGFNAMLVRPETPLAALLRTQGDWQVVDEDRQAVLFLRRSPRGLNVSAQRADQVLKDHANTASTR